MLESVDNELETDEENQDKTSGADCIVVSKAELASNKGLQGPFRIQDVALMKKGTGTWMKLKPTRGEQLLLSKIPRVATKKITF